MNEASVPAFEFVKQLAVELADDNFTLPAFPDTALRVQDAINDPDVTIESLCSIVLLEPTLTACLLRIANSAMMQRGSFEVTDIKIAISRIGFAMVQTASVSLAANEVFKAPAGSLLSAYLEKVRKHSVMVCTFSYILAKNVTSDSNPDEAMLAGLLHAIGKFYILARADDHPELFTDVESLEKLLSDWHTSIGHAIIESWGFSEKIVNAIDEHEVVDREGPEEADTTDIVIVANILAKINDDKSLEELELDLDSVPSVLRMKTDSEELMKLIQESEQEISAMMQALSG